MLYYKLNLRNELFDLVPKRSTFEKAQETLKTIKSGAPKKISTDLSMMPAYEPILTKNTYTMEEIQQAVRSYHETNCINEAIRDGHFDCFKPRIDALSYAIKNSIPFETETIVYRGVAAPTKAGMSKEVLNKILNENPAFVSTSLNEGSARLFSNHRYGGSLIKIILPKGTKGLNTGHEIILPMNSKFEIINDNLKNPVVKYIVPKDI